MSSETYDELLKYTIPDNVKSRIPEYFYYALGGEYVSIMGATALIRDEDGLSLLDYDGGTSGYAEAFRMTCRKLNMDWLYEYWANLTWYQSDIFNGEITIEVMKCFDKEDHANAYYQYLLSKRG